MNDHELRLRLGYWLQGMGACQEPGWLEAVQHVPRQALVPDGWFDGIDGRVTSADLLAEEWLDTLYHDVTIVTREDDEGRPTSSSTKPSIVAAMLDFLHVEDRSDVLEIGTGTGYSTALLCHRLGSEHVTSIDNQADLIELARRRIAKIGYEPTLAHIHGADGYPARAPYDRVIGTVFTWPVPLKWVEQTRPGGRIVAVVPTGVVGLTIREDGSAAGRYHRGGFGFMPMRGHTRVYLSEQESVGVLSQDGTGRAWRYPPDILAAGADLAFALLAHSTAAPYHYADWWVREPAGMVVRIVDAADMSWVRIDAGSPQVLQGGPRRLWDEIEALYEQWCQLGAPARERFGLTVTPDGIHTLWLDDPNGDHRWEVTPRVTTVARGG